MEESPIELVLGQAETPSFVSGIGRAEFEKAGIGVSPTLPVSVLWWVVAAALVGAIVWIRLGLVL